RWLVAPLETPRRVTRRYRPDTLILETEFETPSGTVTLIDFMPPRGIASDVVRIVRGRRGKVAMRTELVLRFDYGANVPWVTRTEDGALRAIAGPDMAVLRTPVTVHGEDMKTVGEFTVSAGQSVPFVLTYSPSHEPMPGPVESESALADTEAFWLEWSSICADFGPWTEVVRRSLITLKALTYRPTGGIVAAPTTSLPESIGGSRNWDYRICWLRDATFTLLSLMNGGYYMEAEAWRDWLLRTIAGSPSQLQPLYGLAGERRLTEWEVPWLPGYEGSRPVRVGNAAESQLQLDVIGEVMDALHQGRSGRLTASDAGWNLQRTLLAHLETIWQQPDRGIWEIRGEPRQFTHSKAMVWVAFDRCIKSAEQFDLPAPLEHWRAVRAHIHDDVCRNGFNAELGSFVQSYGSRELDASLLLLALVGFLPPDDPRIRGTVEAIERHLMVDGFVLRYDPGKTEDGLPEGEGAFLACSFWLVDNYVLLGRYDDAQRLFERLLALGNDVGLLAEEYDPRTGRQVGNFPQAFSHITLATSASNLTHAAKPAEQRACRRAPTPAPAK
ncbi:MAG TPA: glycoside hydrolase family 15 protein, partial [Stellaceae bacterium]|nr:glycoside hydrolase family 15 protein [Stellaceae bacterium]